MKGNRKNLNKAKVRALLLFLGVEIDPLVCNDNIMKCRTRSNRSSNTSIKSSLRKAHF